MRFQRAEVSQKTKTDILAEIRMKMMRKTNKRRKKIKRKNITTTTKNKGGRTV